MHVKRNIGYVYNAFVIATSWFLMIFIIGLHNVNIFSEMK